VLRGAQVPQHEEDVRGVQGQVGVLHRELSVLHWPQVHRVPAKVQVASRRLLRGGLASSLSVMVARSSALF
jgi:hypothetical protein